MAQLKTAWDFVEAHYPNYHSSNEIAHSDDLAKLIDDDYTDDEHDHAANLLRIEYGGDVKNPKIQADYNEVMVNIYEKAIENFLTSANK